MFIFRNYLQFMSHYFECKIGTQYMMTFHKDLMKSESLI